MKSNEEKCRQSNDIAARVQQSANKHTHKMQHNEYTRCTCTIPTNRFSAVPTRSPPTIICKCALSNLFYIWISSVDSSFRIAKHKMASDETLKRTKTLVVFITFVDSLCSISIISPHFLLFNLISLVENKKKTTIKKKRTIESEMRIKRTSRTLQQKCDRCQCKYFEVNNTIIYK